jgi:hypothetical protein
MQAVTRKSAGREFRFAFAMALTGLLATAPRLVRADDETAAAEQRKNPPEGVILLVSPAPEPIPALKYHLLPPAKSRRPGNAAPIYLRLVHENDDAWKKRLSKASDFLDLPVDQLPLDEVLGFLSSYGDVLDQLSAAALRSDCDWNYVIEDRDPLTILLPDAQFMRTYGRLLAIKVRYEARSGELTAAVRSMQDGLALAENAAKAPFLVNRLIGLAISGLMLEQLDVLVQQPGAPNLYWALMELPRPFISFEGGLDTEKRVLELKFPELADLDRPRAAEDWQRISTALRAWAVEVIKMEQREPNRDQTIKQAQQAAAPQAIADARAYLNEKIGLPAALVQAMSDAEIEVRYTVALHAELNDAWHKWFLLPYPQALPRFSKVSGELVAEARRRELYPLVSLLSLGTSDLVSAPARRDRQIARQQAIEAVRMHAAVTGHLPKTLDEVTVVPVPVDPGTAAPFLYKLDEDTATLDIVDTGGPTRDDLHMPIRIRLYSK